MLDKVSSSVKHIANSAPGQFVHRNIYIITPIALLALALGTLLVIRAMKNRKVEDKTTQKAPPKTEDEKAFAKKIATQFKISELDCKYNKKMILDNFDNIQKNIDRDDLRHQTYHDDKIASALYLALLSDDDLKTNCIFQEWCVRDIEEIFDLFVAFDAKIVKQTPQKTPIEIMEDVALKVIKNIKANQLNDSEAHFNAVAELLFKFAKINSFYDKKLDDQQKDNFLRLCSQSLLGKFLRNNPKVLTKAMDLHFANHLDQASLPNILADTKNLRKLASQYLFNNVKDLNNFISISKFSAVYPEINAEDVLQKRNSNKAIRNIELALAIPKCDATQLQSLYEALEDLRPEIRSYIKDRSEKLDLTVSVPFTYEELPEDVTTAELQSRIEIIRQNIDSEDLEKVIKEEFKSSKEHSTGKNTTAITLYLMLEPKKQQLYTLHESLNETGKRKFLASLTQEQQSELNSQINSKSTMIYKLWQKIPILGG